MMSEYLLIFVFKYSNFNIYAPPDFICIQITKSVPRVFGVHRFNLYLSSPRGAWAFHELRRFHTRPLQLNWVPKNVHFGKTPFFGPFLGTVVENESHKRIAPGKNPNIDVQVPKMCFFSKMYIFGDPIELEGPGMVFS